MNKKGFYILFLVLISIIFLSFSIDSVLINQFNNSLFSENLTFSVNENITRYLEIPRYVNVTSAFLNLRGYKVYDVENTELYVTNPNIDDSTGWTYYESDSDYNMIWDGTAAIFGGDGIYDGGAYAKVYQTIDFTKINKLTVYNRYHTIFKCGDSITFCGQFYAGEVTLYSYTDTGAGSATRTFNTSAITGNQEFGSKITSEPTQQQITGGGNWGMDTIHTYGDYLLINPHLKIGTPNGNYEWNHPGEFSSMEKTLDLSSAINSALNSGACNCTGCFLNITTNNCTIPFLFHSDTAGKIEYSDVNISYDLIFTETTYSSDSTGNIIYTDSPSGSSRNKKDSNKKVLIDNPNTTFAEKRDIINLNYNKDSKERVSQEKSNFVKPGIGIIILLILTITGLAVVTVLLKNQ